MFYKFIFSKEYLSILSRVGIISFSYTELTTEPSMIHSHPYCEVIIPENDYGYLIVGNEKIKAERNNVYVINPHISHTETNFYEEDKLTENNHFKYYVVKIEHGIIGKNRKDDVITITNNEYFHELRQYLKNAYGYLVSSADKTLPVLNLSCFYYTFLNKIKSLGYTTSSDVTNYSSVTQELEYFISKNYNEDIKIEELAAKYNVSHNALTRNFKNDTGYTPKEYLIKTRIDSSKYLLSTTDFSISQIAYMCGFVSAAYFTHIFRKAENQTPKEYRANNK